MINYQYVIKDATLRKTTYLIRYQDCLFMAFLKVFSGSMVSFKVHKDYFEFSLTQPASHKELCEMGREIAKHSTYLANLTKKYIYTRGDGRPGRSSQLFVRKAA